MAKFGRSLFESLFRKHRQELLSFAGRRAGPAGAEDIVQEAYARLLQLPEPDRIENPRAYLYRVVANLAAKESLRDRERVTTADLEDAIESLQIPESQPDSAAGAAIQLSRCVAVLDELPKLQRHAFLLHRIDGLTHAEVAKTLGLSKRTVERYVARALAHCLMRLGQKPSAAGGGAAGRKHS